MNFEEQLRSLRAAVVALTLIVGILTAFVYVNAKEIRLLRLKNDVSQLEARFLTRKIGELRLATREETALANLRVDLAVAGFRSGHYRAYVEMVAEARHSGLLQEGFLDAQ
jgi:hypothetical protein